MNSLLANKTTLKDLTMQFEADGYLILRNFAPLEIVERIKEVSQRDISEARQPIEYEADVKYPGSPISLDSEGGKTIRRLRQALSRDPVFQQWVCWNPLVKILQSLLGSPVCCPLAHHNCVMSKQPRFSSDTGWHRDLRFWDFIQPDLINVWLALGEEHLENGCLKVLPGTHRMPFSREQLDDRHFLDIKHPQNQALLETAVIAELHPQDVLLFHAQTFHAATRNFTNQAKFSAVFTFHGPENSPTPQSRSANYPELILPVVSDSN